MLANRGKLPLGSKDDDQPSCSAVEALTALCRNLNSPAILAVRLLWPLSYPQPPSLGKCGNPRFVRVSKRCGNRGKVRLLTFPRLPRRVIFTAKPANQPNQPLRAYRHADGTILSSSGHFRKAA